MLKILKYNIAKHESGDQNLKTKRIFNTWAAYSRGKITKCA